MMCGPIFLSSRKKLNEIEFEQSLKITHLIPKKGASSGSSSLQLTHSFARVRIAAIFSSYANYHQSWDLQQYGNVELA
jgi:hypothetical protein